jgi:hypothetical protein
MSDDDAIGAVIDEMYAMISGQPGRAIGRASATASCPKRGKSGPGWMSRIVPQ